MGQSHYVRVGAKAAAVVAFAALAGFAGLRASDAQTKSVKIGITLPLTGADAEDALLIKNGAMMAIDEANAKGGVAGYKFEVVVYDSGTATAGQYDPAQAATNAKNGLRQGGGRRCRPADERRRQGDDADPERGEPRHDHALLDQSRHHQPEDSPRSSGRRARRSTSARSRPTPSRARTWPISTPETLKVKSVYILDDSGAYGVGMADSFQKQAEKKGIKVLGRDRLDPKAADYTAILTKIKALNPDALYYGGVARRASSSPSRPMTSFRTMIKGGGDGVQGGSFLTGAGFPAVEGWYATIASPHLTDGTKAAAVRQDVQGDATAWRRTTTPSPPMTRALVIIDAIKRVAASGKPVTRDNGARRHPDAKVPTIQGVVSFDANGDLKDRTVSVFQIKQDTEVTPDDDVGAVPATSAWRRSPEVTVSTISEGGPEMRFRTCCCSRPSTG